MSIQSDLTEVSRYISNIHDMIIYWGKRGQVKDMSIFKELLLNLEKTHTLVGKAQDDFNKAQRKELLDKSSKE